MDSSEALSLVAWAMVVGLLVRRTMFGPQKGYARLALALIWLGEVMVVLSAVAPGLRSVGGVVARAGFVVMFTMLVVQFRWELRRRGPNV